MTKFEINLKRQQLTTITELHAFLLELDTFGKWLGYTYHVCAAQPFHNLGQWCNSILQEHTVKSATNGLTHHISLKHKSK